MRGAANPTSGDDADLTETTEVMKIEQQEERGAKFVTNRQEPEKLPRISKTMFLAAVMATVGNVLAAGYNLGVVNVPEMVLKNFCNETLLSKDYILDETALEMIWSIVVAIYLLGAMIGSFGAVFVANGFGRKPALLINSLLALVVAVMFAITKTLSSVENLIAARFLIGIFSGAASTVVPMYLMESAPTHLRGAMGSMLQLGLTTGILVSQILGQADIIGTEENWPMLLSIYSVFVVIGLSMLAFCPESPSYLYLHRKDEQAAVKALMKFRGGPLETIQEDVMMLKREQKVQDSSPEWSMMQILRAPELRMPLLLVVALQAGQQLSGISIAFYYSTSTFQKIGLTLQQSQYGSIGAGFVNLLMSCVAVPVVNRYNRRTLLKISLSGMIFCLCGFTITTSLQHLASWVPYLVVPFFLSIVGTYGIGLGPLAFMMGSEMFQQGPRAAGMGIGCLANWLANCTVAVTFPLLQEFMGEYVFLIYTGFVACLGVLLYFYLPETKGLEPVEVAAHFRTKSRRTNGVRMCINASRIIENEDYLNTV